MRHWTAIDGRNPPPASKEATPETERHMAVAATAAPPSPTPPLDKAPPPQSNEGRDQTPPRSRSEPTPRSLGRAGSSAEINKRQQSRGRGRGRRRRHLLPCAARSRHAGWRGRGGGACVGTKQSGRGRDGSGWDRSRGYISLPRRVLSPRLLRTEGRRGDEWKGKGTGIIMAN